MSDIPCEAVTDTPETDTTDELLERLLVNIKVVIIVVLSGTEDGFGCETIVVGDVLEDVSMTCGRGMIRSNTGAQEGGPDEHPTQLQATWMKIEKHKK